MKKYAFIDRDGTLIVEPPITKQVSNLEELEFLPKVISSLSVLIQLGYSLVIITNQDNLGTELNPQNNFDLINQKIFQVFASEDITFEAILVCPHSPREKCFCRKPSPKLIIDYLADNLFDKERSFVVGDRESDVLMAEALKIKGYKLANTCQWSDIIRQVRLL